MLYFYKYMRCKYESAALKLSKEKFPCAFFIILNCSRIKFCVDFDGDLCFFQLCAECCNVIVGKIRAMLTRRSAH